MPPNHSRTVHTFFQPNLSDTASSIAPRITTMRHSRSIRERLLTTFKYSLALVGTALWITNSSAQEVKHNVYHWHDIVVLNNNGDIYTDVAAPTGEIRQLKATNNPSLKFQSISSGAGWIYAIGVGGGTYRCLYPCTKGLDYSLEGGSITNIDLADDEMWSLAMSRTFKKANPLTTGKDTTWTVVGSQLATDISARGPMVWIRTPDNTILYCQKPCSGSWANGGGSALAIDADESEVWIVGLSGRLFWRKADASTLWTVINNSNAKTVEVSRWFIWITDAAGKIHACHRPCRTVEGFLPMKNDLAHNMTGPIKQIAAH